MAGGLKYPPDVVWRMTPAEMFLAIEGHNRANRSGPEPMTRAELQELGGDEPRRSIRPKKRA